MNEGFFRRLLDSSHIRTRYAQRLRARKEKAGQDLRCESEGSFLSNEFLHPTV